MTNKPVKVIKKRDLPPKVTDKVDADLIRHAKTILSKIYAKYGIDYREELRRKAA